MSARNAGWRRDKERLNQQRADRIEEWSPAKDRWPVSKSWKFMGRRRDKVARAQKLGFDYPRRTDRQLLEDHRIDDD